MLFFLPGMALHAKARDRAFEYCVVRAEEYLQLIQRQGYCTEELWRELGGTGKGIRREAELAVQIASVKNGWVYTALSPDDCEVYMGERIFPFHTGDMVRIQIRMPYDGLERFYFGLCFPEEDARRSVRSGMIRDGLLERLGEQQAGEGEEER